MFRTCNMRVEDMETMAEMVALDHNDDPEKGYRKARKHMLGHIKIVPQHCYVVENDEKQVIAAMILHPQDEVFEIEDFHVKEIHQNKEASNLLKAKLLKYLEKVQTEVLCYPSAIRKLMATY